MSRSLRSFLNSEPELNLSSPGCFRSEFLPGRHCTPEEKDLIGKKVWLPYWKMTKLCS